MYVNRTGWTNQKCLWYTATQRPLTCVVSNITQIQDVTNVLKQTSGVSSWHQNKDKSSYEYMSANIWPPRSPDFSPFDFYLWGTLKNFSVFSPIWKRRHVTSVCFMSVKPFATAAWPFNICGTPWSDVSVRALIGVEDILSFCCELWLNRKIITQ